VGQHSPGVVWHAGSFGRDERKSALGIAGATVWFTGLSGSGKSSIAVACERLLIAAGKPAYLLDGDNLHPVQEAFVEEDALMCGFCTPGFVVSVAALVAENDDPTLDEVKKALSGNLCRCGTYTRVFAAAQTAARRVREGA